MNLSLLRARARDNLRGNWPLSIGVAAVAVLFGGLIAGMSFLPRISAGTEMEVLQKLNRILEDGIRIGRFTFGVNNGIFGLAKFILGGVIQLGFVRFLLKQHDGAPLNWQDLFSQFDRFGQGFAQKFLRDLYTALWGLLLIVPGIVKSLSYAMTPYIMAEEPNLNASEAIQKSMLMMEGHKWNLFLLHLSFLGWDILAALTAGIGNLILNPYKNAAMTAFYRELKGNHPYL